MEKKYFGTDGIRGKVNNSNINGQMLVLGPKRIPYKNIKRILTNFTDIINDVL